MGSILESYGDVLAEREAVWKEKYSPAVIEALKSEASVLGKNLERVVCGLSTDDPVDPLEFYRNPDFADYVLDESRVSSEVEVSSDEMEILRLVAQNTQVLKVNPASAKHYKAQKKVAGSYHHTFRTGELKQAILSCWYRTRPEIFLAEGERQLVSVTEKLEGMRSRGVDTLPRKLRRNDFELDRFESTVRCQAALDEMINNWPEVMQKGVEELPWAAYASIERDMKKRIVRMRRRKLLTVILNRSSNSLCSVPKRYLVPPPQDGGQDISSGS